MEYKVDYFIKKFSAIPENKWCTNILTDIEGRHCAQGHLGITNENMRMVYGHKFEEIPNGLSEAWYLYEIFHSANLMVWDVNNGRNSNYKQETPKQRILAALYDIKKAQQPIYQDITSSIAKELIESPECTDIVTIKI